MALNYKKSLPRHWKPAEKVGRSVASGYKSLSARLLFLTIAFVMLAEFLIYTPSIARFRLDYLESKLAAGHLAILALEAAPQQMVSNQMEQQLLDHVGATYIALKQPGTTATLVLSRPQRQPFVETFDLRRSTFIDLMANAYSALFRQGDRIIRIIGVSPTDQQSIVEISISEEELCAEMIAYSYRILGLSLIISIITASLVFIALLFGFVRPMQRLRDAMIAFRKNPEDIHSLISPSGREDELGMAEKELKKLQTSLRTSLHQKARLAALGQAVSKINHDLRNILTSAQLLTDRLQDSDDPKVKKSAPILLQAIDRAVNLCKRTLEYSSGKPSLEHMSRFNLESLIHEVQENAKSLSADGACNVLSDIPDSFTLRGEREELFRVFLNLFNNATKAGASQISITLKPSNGHVEIFISDNGSGISEKAREHLFEPFAVTNDDGGSGLGLAISKEIIESHGGNLELVKSDSTGTTFAITLPRK